MSFENIFEGVIIKQEKCDKCEEIAEHYLPMPFWKGKYYRLCNLHFGKYLELKERLIIAVSTEGDSK